MRKSVLHAYQAAENETPSRKELAPMHFSSDCTQVINPSRLHILNTFGMRESKKKKRGFYCNATRWNEAMKNDNLVKLV